MDFDDNVSKAILDLFETISNVAQSTSNTLENVMNNLNTDTKFQESINNMVAVLTIPQDSFNFLSEEMLSPLKDTLKQVAYNAENALNCSNIITEILPTMDIPALNHCMQDIYENVPEDVSTNFNETELNIANNIQLCIKAYNANPNTSTKIKMPVDKEIMYSIFLFILIAIILACSGYKITEHLPSILDGFLVNIGYNELTKKSSK